MRIANPIYDVALAKLLLSTILQEEVTELVFRPQERITEIGSRYLTVYRLDFAATVKNGHPSFPSLHFFLASWLPRSSVGASRDAPASREPSANCPMGWDCHHIHQSRVPVCLSLMPPSLAIPILEMTRRWSVGTCSHAGAWEPESQRTTPDATKNQKVSTTFGLF
ncbi:hypothetical protein CCP4SC76_3260026 [Gammaproteobacteria bacterium]